MTLLPAVFFSDGLIGEIFSVLPVKSLLRFRCLSKSCDTLISDPTFVKLQLKRRSATPNPHFLLILSDSLSFTISMDPYYTVKTKDAPALLVLAVRYNRRELRSNARILGFGNNDWRHIESFPVDPISLDYDGPTSVSDGVYFRSTLNWLAIQNQLQYILSTIKDITVENFVIVSFDLRTETYNRYFLPRDFDEETDFIIWQMKKFGVEDSWTPLLKISYQNLQIDYDYSFDFMKYHFNLQSLFLSEDGDTLILDSSQEMEVILYNLRDNTVRRTEASVSSSIIDHRTNVRTSTSISWYMAMDYVESLVLIC
ncbi:putative F-box domain-containing protein [Medicago truncatula]|uniref:Putative F-box domain-containing protein n=1 Tax=Medicago truncatula TaxID=3880 RepID=A0A396H104_MEDTR|nr:putative F-box domain-containing protein [Medicago truncatula]